MYIRMVLADRNELFLNGLANALQSFQDIVVVGKCRSIEEVIEQLNKFRPDLLISGHKLLGNVYVINDLCRIRNNYYSNMKLIFLSMNSSVECIEDARIGGAD